MSQIVYSNTAVNSTHGVVELNHHTDEIAFMNKDYNHFVEIKLNGGPHIIVLPENSKNEDYIKIPGDYKTFEVLTATANVAVYAVG